MARPTDGRGRLPPTRTLHSALISPLAQQVSQTGATPTGRGPIAFVFGLFLVQDINGFSELLVASASSQGNVTCKSIYERFVIYEMHRL